MYFRFYVILIRVHVYFRFQGIRFKVDVDDVDDWNGNDDMDVFDWSYEERPDRGEDDANKHTFNIEGTRDERPSE